MPDEVIETSGTEAPTEPPLTNQQEAQDLAIKVARACGHAKNNEGQTMLIARPVLIPELATASTELLRATLRVTMPPTWLVRMPALGTRIDELEENDLRTLLILTACFYSLGRAQAYIEISQQQNGDK